MIPKLDIEIIQNKKSTHMKIVRYSNHEYYYWCHGGTYIWLENTGNICKTQYPLEFVPYMFGYSYIKYLRSLYKYTYQREVHGYRVKKL